MKAMIFAAGLGTRLAHLTNNKPKALVEVRGKTMLEHQIEKLKNNGFNYIVINVHHFANLIKDFVNSKNFGVDIVISDESEKLLNTGGGLKNAKKWFSPGDKFLIHNVDIFSDINLSELFDYHSNSGNVATLAVTHRKSSKHLLFDNDKRLCGWKDISNNKQIITIHRANYDEMAFSGIYVVNYEIFDLINQEGSFPIIPVLLDLSKENRIGGWEHDKNFVIDLGKINAIAEYEKFLLNQN